MPQSSVVVNLEQRASCGQRAARVPRDRPSSLHSVRPAALAILHEGELARVDYEPAVCDLLRRQAAFAGLLADAVAGYTEDFCGFVGGDQLVRVHGFGSFGRLVVKHRW